MKTNLINKLTLLQAIIILFPSIFFSCDSFNFNKEKPSDHLEIEATIEVGEQTISTMGGTISVEDFSSSVDGLEITVPANSYPESKTFTISTAEITNHKLGDYFKPITPLILIENGGDYANEIMEITIPITLSEGEIPLGFYYNELDGTLESIPTKAYTSNSITLLTRHFMSASDFKTENTQEKSAPVSISTASKLVISSISEILIDLTPIISSGFNVGKDDWEFTNYGSYIAPGGHCAGQNMAAMWYYYEKTLKGEESLFEKFNTHDNLWQDNAVGYKFCSVIHADLEWDGYLAKLFDQFIDRNQELDKLKFYTIAGAMMVTGEPQGIGIYRQTGTNTDGTPQYGGHDLICYKIDPNEGKLFISDPNKPGVEQSILLKDNKFEPYVAKTNGNTPSNPYPFVTYYAKTAYIDWNKISSRYTEVLDSTIGNNAPNTFPEYSIVVKEEKKEDDYQFWNGMTINSDTLRCVVQCPTSEVYYNIDNTKLIGFAIYNEDGQKISISESKWQNYVLLKPGLNRLAFYIYGWRSGSKFSNGEYIDKFIDFKWFNVYNSKLTIEPNQAESEPDEEIEFEAVFDGDLPASVKYVWDFGDNEKKQTVLNENTITYKYKKEGEYEITVELYDNTKDQLIDKAISQATITKTNDNLSKLKKSKHIAFDGSFDYYTNSTENVFGGGFHFLRVYGDVQWSGNSFTITHNYEDSDATGYKTIQVETIKGTASSDARKLTTFTYEANKEYYYSNKWSNTTVEKITLIDVPIVYAKDEIEWGSGPADHFRYELEKGEILPQITDFTYGSYGLNWSSDIRDYVEYDWRWGKSHIVEFWDSFRIEFFETSE